MLARKQGIVWLSWWTNTISLCCRLSAVSYTHLDVYKRQAFVELPNTFPTYVSTGNLIMENTLVVPQVLYWLNMSTNTILDGFKFINNYASSEEWRDLPEDE